MKEKKNDYKPFCTRVVLTAIVIMCAFSVAMWTHAVAAERDTDADRKAITMAQEKLLKEHLKKADEYYREGRLISAIIFYDKALGIDPAHRTALAKREASRKFLARKGTLEDALPGDEQKRTEAVRNMYKKAVQQYKDATFTQSRKTFTDVWILEGDYKATLSYLDKIDKALVRAEERKKEEEQKAREERIDTLLGEAKAAAKKKDYTTAIARCEQILSLDSDNKKARALLTDYKEEQTETQAIAAQDEKEGKVVALLQNAERLFNASKYDQATAEYHKVLALDEANKKAKNGLEEVNEAIQKEKIAQARADQGEKERSIKTLLYNAERLFNASKYDLAIAEYHKVLALDEANKKAKNGLEEVNEAIQKEKIAQARLKSDTEQKRKVSERKKREARIEALLDNANGFYRENKFEVAITTYRKALALEGDNAQALKGIEKSEEKIREQEQRQRKGHIQALLEKARTLEKSKNPTSALGVYKEVLTIDPNHQKALRGIDECNRELARIKQKEKEEKELAALAEQERIQQEAEERTQQKVKKKEQADRYIQKAKEQLGDADYVGAMEWYDRALTLLPGYAEAVTGRKNVEKQRAIAERRAVQKAESREAASRAETLLREGKLDEAKAQAIRALELNPENRNAQNVLNDIDAAMLKKKKQQAEALVDRGIAEMKARQYKDAIGSFQEALRIDPGNSTAVGRIEECNRELARAQEEREKQLEIEQKDRAEFLFKEGLEAYEQEDVETAVEQWRSALSVYPEHPQAATYLEETKDEYEKALAERESAEERMRIERTAQEMLDTPIPAIKIELLPQTMEEGNLKEFLDTISLASGLDYVLSYHIVARIQGEFEDKTPREILDSALIPLGMTWYRREGTNIIAVEPDLKVKHFTLTREEMQKVKVSLDDKTIQQMLWKSEAPPMSGVGIDLNEREARLTLSDSQKNIEILTSFLSSLETEIEPPLITSFYEIESEKGERIIELLQAMLRVEEDVPWKTKRQLIYTEGTLIIKDTPENIERVEMILSDKGFLDKIREGITRVKRFSIIPRQAIQQEPSKLKQFGEQIIETIKVVLYSQTGITAAEEEGRRLYYDEDTMQVTVIDYPDNLDRVDEFISQITELERVGKEKIFFLKNTNVGELLTDLTAAVGEGVGVERETFAAKTMRQEQEWTFRTLSIRLLRVNENNEEDEDDDSAEFLLRTQTTRDNPTIGEFETHEIDEYEMFIKEIRPSGTTGEGRVELEITYFPEGQEAPPLEEPAPEEGAAPEEEEDPQIVSQFDRLNAFMVRYRDPAKLRNFEEKIELLDVPSPQVQIEAKFVEVSETKAREMSSEFTLLNLQEGKVDFDFDQSLIDLDFARDWTEFETFYEPFSEGVNFTELLKGTTILKWVMGGATPLEWELRLLEASGVVNVVNAPVITVIQNESASFNIRYEEYRWLGERSGELVTYFQDGDEVDLVDLQVEPRIISKGGTIELDISGIITDYTTDAGAKAFQITDPTKYATINWGRVRIQKDITTIARVTDGGTIVMGGWTSERSSDHQSGVPILRHIPFVGKLFFGRNKTTLERKRLLIFLTARVID